jgi:hypothetical protein
MIETRTDPVNDERLFHNGYRRLCGCGGPGPTGVPLCSRSANTLHGDKPWFTLHLPMPWSRMQSYIADPMTAAYLFLARMVWVGPQGQVQLTTAATMTLRPEVRAQVMLAAQLHAQTQDRSGDGVLDQDRVFQDCEWFAGCTEPADGLVEHIVLGPVPTCARCALLTPEMSCF